MPFLKTPCTKCSKPFETEKSFEIAGKTVLRGKCGHIMTQDQIKPADPYALVSVDGRKLYPFQADTVTFMEASGGKALIAHEMGLGKTVCALGFLAAHLKEATPFLAVVKRSLTYQWQHETMRWLGEDHFAQIIGDSRTPLLPGVTGYIISYDLLRRHKTLSDQLQQRGVKTLILDECQQIKNSESQRTIEVRNLVRHFDNVFALSGTPIKNNAEEYFPVLNIISPTTFPKFSQFQMYDCESYWDGRKYRTGGLRNPEAFMSKTKRFIIRKERKDVKEQIGLNHTEADRRFSFHELSKEVEKLYEVTYRQFRDEFNETGGSGGFEETSNILAFLSRMRHLAGISLVDPVIDHTMEFLGSTDRKLVIFVHHQDVGLMIQTKLESLMKELGLEPPRNLTSNLDAQQRSDIVNWFNSTDKCVLVASTLASGEGLNLQTCSDCLMVERQWNPANEEQAESRFIRIGQTEQVTATYFIAVGTVVEFFSEIVERKREIVSKTLSGQAAKWDQSSLIKELSEALASSGGKRWGW